MKKHLTIYFTSDTHGYFPAVDYATGKTAATGVVNCAADFVQDGNSLILDGGDTLQGSPFTYFLHEQGKPEGEICARLMNLCGYQFVTLGNHDFNYGRENLQRYLNALDARCLCANVEGLDKVEKTAVVTLVNGLRVGLTGIVTHFINIWEKPENLRGITITEPITAMLVFFVAVVMVILATFLLFIAGSVTLCRTLQGNDRFYYQKKNFVALSSLVYRMKRSGAGLAVICILSTMILVMLGSTAGLYFGAEDVVRTLSAEMSREIAAEARAEFYATYGSLFFLALVLSTVFLLASVLMLYYKQLSEGYEDAARFAVMQRVGMTKRDIRTSVNAQLRMVFLLPLLAAFVHLAFAQPMIWRILRLFGLQNLPLVLGVTACACAVFTVLYCAACRLTSNAYCRIVGEGV